MIIKRYVVNNMNEAMVRIKYELGIEAVIISQKKIKKPGIKGYFLKKSLEVTAAVDNVKTKEVVSSQSELVLIKEIKEMRSTLNDIKTASSTRTARKSKLIMKLEACDVSDKNIKKIVTLVKNSKVVKDKNSIIAKTIEGLISITKEDIAGTLVLVGPTGVGKTTTIAKLAGRLSFIDKKKVGLITVDTYRIGAVDQLRAYANIMDLPFKVVTTLKEMEPTIKSMKNCDVILIDTTGRSSKNVFQISELRAFVEKAASNNVSLVVSSTTKEKDINAITEGFRELNYNNVIITKLDETTTYGSILNIMECANKPLSFVTTGQNVPEDLKRITQVEAASLILGEDKI